MLFHFVLYKHPFGGVSFTREIAAFVPAPAPCFSLCIKPNKSIKILEIEDRQYICFVYVCIDVHTCGQQVNAYGELFPYNTVAKFA